LVSFRNLVIMQVANTFAATTTPAGVGGLALSVRFLQKGGLGAVRATAAVALQQAVQVITHVGLLILFSIVAGTSADLSHFVPDATVLYLLAGVGVGIIGAFMFVRRRRGGRTDRWSRGLRAARNHRRALGAALPRAHLLAAGVLWVADDALADREEHDLIRVIRPWSRRVRP
jgi:uncharacterized membrane protein YbhN (UPF0104 family)